MSSDIKPRNQSNGLNNGGFLLHFHSFGQVLPKTGLYVAVRRRIISRLILICRLLQFSHLLSIVQGMTHHAMFPDLVFDENDNRVDVTYVGGDAHYVIDDMGFKRHVPAETLDRQIVEIMMEQLQGNQDMAVDQALRMMGQDDLFTKAAVDAQIRNTTVEDVVGQMIPPQAREMMAMMGFKIIVNYRGELVKFDQPTIPHDGDGDY